MTDTPMLSQMRQKLRKLARLALWKTREWQASAKTWRYRQKLARDQGAQGAMARNAPAVASDTVMAPSQVAKPPYDVAILGWWYGKNYGSILTYYGLNKAIETLGHSVLMVHEPLGYNGYRVAWPDDILSMKFAKRVGYNTTKQFHFSQLPALNHEAKTFVVGSDQLWNPQIGRVNDDLFLDFVSPENRRVAYATSFGNKGIEKFKPEFIGKHSENLQKFDAISVREGYAVDTARDVFGVAATQVLDPVFLLPKAQYQSLADQAPSEIKAQLQGDFLAVFYLDPNPEKRDVALAVADKLGLERIVVIPNPDRGRDEARKIFNDPRFEILEQDAPEIFLKAYAQASYVITDSFHGTAFAVIFEKSFSSIYNTKRGADRFKNLLGALGYGEKRRLHEKDTVETIAANANVAFKINHAPAQQTIARESKASLAWLAQALAKTSGPSRAAVLQSKAASNRHHLVKTVERPHFVTNSPVWKISAGKTGTLLQLAPEGAVKGNQVWAALPFALQAKQAYRLTVSWTVSSKAPAINLHGRDSQKGSFRVIGSVQSSNRSWGKRSDKIEFEAPVSGLDQFMLGAVHFTGEKAGAEVASITLEEIASLAAAPVEVLTAAKVDDPALALALQDHSRYTSSLNKARGKGKVAAQARLMFHAHAIEKGLSRSNLRPGFGNIAVPGLAKEMTAWLAKGYERDNQYFKTGAGVMQAYFARHEAIKFDVSNFRSLFSAELLEIIAKAEPDQGGVIAAAADREALVKSAGENRSFLDVLFGRRSVREFTLQPVDDAAIRDAVRIAMQAPSVCNRQAARVRQIDDPKLMKTVLDLQGGFGGYQMPPKLLLITCDVTAFLFITERNQAYIDGGLFMMNLLLGLEQMGLGSCSLNTAMGKEKDAGIRRALNIPENEVFIAFVAVGHYDPEIQVPRSKRVSVDEVLIRSA